MPKAEVGCVWGGVVTERLSQTGFLHRDRAKRRVIRQTAARLRGEQDVQGGGGLMIRHTTAGGARRLGEASLLR